MINRKRARTNLCIVLGLLIPILLAALRYNVGTDYASYVRQSVFMDEHNFFFGRDAFWNVIANFTMAAGNHAIFVLAFYSSITVVFFYLAARKALGKYAWLAWLLFLCILYPVSLNAVRQLAAVSVAFFVSIYVVRGLINGEIVIRRLRTWVGYILAGVFAVLLHSTALVALLFAPIYMTVRLIDRGKNRELYIRAIKTIAAGVLISAVSILVVWFMARSIVEIPVFAKYAGIFNREDRMPNILTAVAPAAVQIFFWRRAAKTTLNKFLLASGVTYSILIIALSAIIPYGYRIAWYFMPVYFLQFALIAESFKRNKSIHYKYLAYSFVILWSVGFFILSFYRNGSHDIFPYQFIFGGL